MGDVVLDALTSIAVNDGPGRTADNPSGVGGILIIVGIAVAFLALAALGLWMASKRSGRAS
jgi:hypothetical protein